jgi:hypothetical protein
MYTLIASFKRSVILLHTHYGYIYTWHISPCSPFHSPLLPLVLLSTYLAPSSCDRNRPPPSQVACKLTLFAPPFTQLSHPSQLPRTPTAQRPTTTTLGLFRSCYAEQVYEVKIAVLAIPNCLSNGLGLQCMQLQVAPGNPR